MLPDLHGNHGGIFQSKGHLEVGGIVPFLLPAGLEAPGLANLVDGLCFQDDCPGGLLSSGLDDFIN